MQKEYVEDTKHGIQLCVSIAEVYHMADILTSQNNVVIASQLVEGVELATRHKDVIDVCFSGAEFGILCVGTVLRVIIEVRESRTKSESMIIFCKHAYISCASYLADGCTKYMLFKLGTCLGTFSPIFYVTCGFVGGFYIANEIGNKVEHCFQHKKAWRENSKQAGMIVKACMAVTLAIVTILCPTAGIAILGAAVAIFLSKKLYAKIN